MPPKDIATVAEPVSVAPPTVPEPVIEDKPVPPPAPVNDSDLTTTVIEVVVNHTGYPADFVELDQDLEGELGIDTVKQAEIMADIRERFSLPLDEEFVLSDYPTLNHMIGYIQQMTGSDAPVAALSAPTLVAPVVEAVAEVSTPSKPESKPSIQVDADQLTKTVIEVVVNHTGYPCLLYTSPSPRDPH